MARPLKVTDAQILEVACRCFIEGGPAVPTSAIAAELGVSEAALYKRFGTKQELMVRACQPPAVPEFLQTLATGPVPGEPIGDQIAQMAHIMLAFFRALMPRLAVLKAAGISPLDLLARFDVPPPVLGQRALKAWFDRAVAQGSLVVEDTDALAFVFMGSLQARAMLAHLAGDHLPQFDVDRYVDQLVRMLLDGVRAPQEAS